MEVPIQCDGNFKKRRVPTWNNFSDFSATYLKRERKWFNISTSLKIDLSCILGKQNLKTFNSLLVQSRYENNKNDTFKFCIFISY